MIRVSDATVRFKDRTVLNHVSVEVEDGQAVALVGPNGAGKSTLLRVLARLEGQHRVSLSPDVDARDWAKHVAFVPQAHSVVFDFSVLEFVLMGFAARNSKWALESTEQRQAAREALAQMDVDAHALKPITALSAGEFQRVLMARTLITRTRVWLLDEPTSNLDLKHQLRLLDTVRDHTRAGGIAVAILHDLGLAARYFDRVIGLKAGTIVFDGRPDDVLTTPYLEALYDVKMVRLSDGQHTSFAAVADPFVP